MVICEPAIFVKDATIPQSSKCSLSQMLFILRTLERPSVTKVSAAVSTASPAPEELSSFNVQYPLSAGMRAIACDILA